jgi:hypothetical protein
MELTYDHQKYSNEHETLRYPSGRFCFVEFNDKILIESEDVSLDYYINKLPVYNFLGQLLLPNMANLSNINNLFVLDINKHFIELIGLNKYINPILPVNFSTLQEKKCHFILVCLFFLTASIVSNTNGFHIYKNFGIDSLSFIIYQIWKIIKSDFSKHRLRVDIPFFLVVRFFIGSLRGIFLILNQGMLYFPVCAW